MVQVSTVLELEEDCAGTFDTSPPAVGDPATFTVDGDRIIVRGTLGPTTPARLQAALDDNPDARTLVMTNVPGTVDSVESDIAARTIRRANLATCVPDTGFISSGAVEFFLAGSVRRVAPNNQGVVVHGWITEQCLPTGECPEVEGAEGCVRGADLSMDDPQHEPFLELYRDLGLPSDFYFWIFDRATSFCQPHFMTDADLEQFSFDTSNACIDSLPGAICNTPPGLFTESCRNCFFNEPTLQCDCQDLAGGLSTTSIDVSTCDGLVSNCGGELSCEACDLGTGLVSIAWDGDANLDLILTDPEGRSIRPGGPNETDNCTASADATNGPGASEAISCVSPSEGVYLARVEQNPPGETEAFTFERGAPASGPISVSAEVVAARDIVALVGDSIALELTWTVNDNLELILVDEETMRAVTPHGTGFDPLPDCAVSADNDGSDVFESPKRETISCTGLDIDNYQIEVESPGGGVAFDIPYTLQVSDGKGSAVTIEQMVRPATRRELDLVVLGSAGIVDGIECTVELDCDAPAATCRVAVCEANACVEEVASDGFPCRDSEGAVGACFGGDCNVIIGL